jgi:DNA-directed RNA polymerase specialized sigma24 family protein
MNWLSEVAKNHKNYVKIINSFGEYFYAEDLVQEMYLRLDRNKQPEQIIVNGKVNEYYIYLTLKSIFLNFVKAKEQVYKTNDLPLNIEAVDNTEYYEAQFRFNSIIEAEIDKWEWYDAMLFRLYLDSGKSMRDISDGTTISLRSVFDTLAECKRKLKANCKEDYDDLINNDFELI